MIKINGKEILINGNSIKFPFNIEKAWEYPVQAFIIVLMRFYENRDTKRFHNLIACDSGGGVIWEADLPPGTGADCYTDASLKGETVSAFSLSCYRCDIDVKTGRLVDTFPAPWDYETKLIALSPDGRLLAFIAADGTIRIWGVRKE